MNNLRKLNFFLPGYASCRTESSNASLIKNMTDVINRNPRNLELMTIARKPIGYHLEVKGHEFWHKLIISVNQRNVTAEVHHFENGCVVSASSKEWALKKQLYKPNDVSAYTNLGRVLAQRCLECGITSVFYDVEKTVSSQKIKSLLDEVQKAGLSLQEPKVYSHPYVWSKTRPVKPWTLVE